MPAMWKVFRRFQTVVKVEQNGSVSIIAFGIMLVAVLPRFIIGIIIFLQVVGALCVSLKIFFW